jgi:naphthoate synthase
MERVSELFDDTLWASVAGFEALTDVTYHHDLAGRIARVAINRPEVRNAFRPETVDELFRVLDDVRQNPRIGVVLLTGNGPSAKDGGWAFSAGGDQRVRGKNGYEYEGDPRGLGKLHILEVQRLIRFMPKVVIAVIPGWAAGGGHSLHVVCDLSIASAENAMFKQTDADVGSFDAGLGSAYFARQVGQKIAREVFFLAREYDAQRALQIGAVNAVVQHADLERTAYQWATEIMGKSPTSIRMLKFALNAVDDGLIGQQVFAGEATRLAYGTDEAAEGRNAFLEKRDPDWSAYPWQF